MSDSVIFKTGTGIYADMMDATEKLDSSYCTKFSYQLVHDKKDYSEFVQAGRHFKKYLAIALQLQRMKDGQELIVADADTAIGLRAPFPHGDELSAVHCECLGSRTFCDSVIIMRVTDSIRRIFSSAFFNGPINGDTGKFANVARFRREIEVNNIFVNPLSRRFNTFRNLWDGQDTDLVLHWAVMDKQLALTEMKTFCERALNNGN